MKKKHKIIIGSVVILGLGYYIYQKNENTGINEFMDLLIKNGIGNSINGKDADIIFLKSIREMKYQGCNDEQLLEIITNARRNNEIIFTKISKEVQLKNTDTLKWYCTPIFSNVKKICSKI